MAKNGTTKAHGNGTRLAPQNQQEARLRKEEEATG